jgi:2'-5' RNA ligase
VVLRLVVVLPLLPLRHGDAFTLATWPLHLTLVPTFVVDLDLDAVVAVIQPALARQSALLVTVGGDEGFGRAQRIPVSLIEDSSELIPLHHVLLDGLTAAGAAFDDPDFTGGGYRPHITMTRTARAHPGELLRLGQATVVDMEPIGPTRLRRVAWAAPLAVAGS